ncbi:MAG TPA: TIGR03364 family FAD-dependent oxidoreductase [Pseudonocardiaceae bacterium]
MTSPTVDLVVIGAGIVGLAHAVDAVARGLSVMVIERDEYPCGASVRNFGHCCVTAQDGDALRYGMAARTTWQRLAKAAGIWLSDTGTVVVARADDEYAVLSEFRAVRDDQVVLLDADAVRERVPVGADVVGGAWFPLDLRVDPRAAVPAIAGRLAEQGVRFRWGCTVWGVEPGLVTTSRGPVQARRVVVAVGHDVDRHFPELADDARVTRCSLHMLRVANPTGRAIDPGVFTGLSLLRYSGFTACPALPALRARFAADSPGLLEHGVNLMFTQLPGGDLTIGDTHTYGRTVDPYRDENLDALVLTETARLLGVDRLTVRERWQGVYAAAPEPFLIAAPMPDVRVVSVTSGIGMTTALGLAPDVLDDLLTD